MIPLPELGFLYSGWFHKLVCALCWTNHLSPTPNFWEAFSGRKVQCKTQKIVVERKTIYEIYSWSMKFTLIVIIYRLNVSAMLNNLSSRLLLRVKADSDFIIFNKPNLSMSQNWFFCLTGYLSLNWALKLICYKKKFETKISQQNF